MFFFTTILAALSLVGSVASAPQMGAAIATRIHANEGCITVNYVPVCAPESVDAYAGRATIHARFSGSISDKIIVNAGCQLNAKWPVGWGDIYFGADNCLYDSSGQGIDGQCCNAGTGSSVKVTNPYYQP
ncbi:hypothetical protein C8J57DRAFT_1611919 [Mycena rebaudengoi]|nr:hypothetical protein C8J57DRAFT_1611919 [Mycena rebaudengoi]